MKGPPRFSGSSSQGRYFKAKVVSQKFLYTPFVVSPSFDFAQDIREKPFVRPVPGRVGPGRLSKDERLAQPPAQAPPQRESLWLGEDRPCRTMNGTH